MAREIAARHAAVIAEEVPKVFAELLAIGPLRMRALEIATELRHPTYDCFHLALAELRAASFVTADRRLIARVAGTPWEAQMVSLWQ